MACSAACLRAVQREAEPEGRGWRTGVAFFEQNPMIIVWGSPGIWDLDTETPGACTVRSVLGSGKLSSPSHRPAGSLLLPLLPSLDPLACQLGGGKTGSLPRPALR